MFSGFSDAASDFLWGIRLNNERSWFNEHKQEYLTNLWTPFRELAGEVYDRFSAEHAELYLNLHVSRIYRDARRLHGRGPYKDHLWFSIRPNDEHWYERPVFWFEIVPEGYSFGLGIYAQSPAQMARFRHEVDSGSPGLLHLAKAFEKQQLFVLEGDEYARSKGSPPAPLDKWYNRKEINLACRRQHDALYYSAELAKEVAGGYSALLPYYRYFDALAHRMAEERSAVQASQKNNFDF